MKRFGLYLIKRGWAMPAAVDTSRLHVLHVLTLNGRNGEYGGPVRVARELCTELNSRGHTTRIFSGALKGSEPSPKDGLVEKFIVVKPISRKQPVSSLWSWRLIAPLTKQIRKADLVHIHFARDLIPFLAAAISILSRKPFVTQTHGMIIFDGRGSTRLIDFIFTRMLINKSKTNLVLSDIELSSVLELGITSPCKILPNGIAPKNIDKVRREPTNRVVFCSRLEKRKGVEKFVALAESFRDSGIKFEIYGPDGGELQLVQYEIKSRNLKDILEYKGSLPAERVQDVLGEIDVLVLPSKDEPFPMVILEALAVGTPVIIMPSCGFANQLYKFESSFVANTDDLQGLIFSLNKQKVSRYSNKSHSEIINFCKNEFGIASVTTELLGEYMKAFSHAK
jgi:glycosyltransferase involved in cell wall biosynthesis